MKTLSSADATTTRVTPEEAAHGLTEHALLALDVARCAVGKVKPGGSLTFMGGTGGRRLRVGMAIVSTATVGLPTLIASLALEIAPIRVNLIAAGFVDTPLPWGVDRRRIQDPIDSLIDGWPHPLC